MTRCCFLVSVIALAIAPTAARADEFSLHALLSGQTAVTSNAFSTPDGSTDSSGASINYQIRPGFLFSYHTERSLHEVQVDSGIDGNDFTSNVTLTYRGSWRMTYSLTPRSEAEAGAGVAGGRVNALATSQPANVGGPSVLPTGQVDFLQADASEAVSYQISPRMSARESVFGRYLSTKNRGEPPPPMSFNTSGFDIGASLGGQRTFKVTAVSLELQSSFQRLGTEDPPGSGLVVDRDQLDARGVLRYQRDFSEHVSGSVEGGVVSLIPLENGEKLVYQPLAAITAAYVPAWGSTALTVRHGVAPNLFLAQNEITDSVTVNAAVPLPIPGFGGRFAPQFAFLASTGYSRTRFLDLDDGSTRQKFNVIYSDLALQYTPKPSMSMALRYQFIRQSAVESDIPDPALMQLAYIRHTVMFTFFARWPDRVAAEIPVKSQLRVRDITPLGEDVNNGIQGGPGER